MNWPFLTLFFLCVGCFAFFIGFTRNDWVCERRLAFIDARLVYGAWLISLDRHQEAHLFNIEPVCGSYDRWIWRFWCWNPAKLALDAERYNEVMDFEKNNPEAAEAAKKRIEEVRKGKFTCQ